MKVLVIGQNSKMANVLGFFCSEVYMAIDERISNYRSYTENSRFPQLTTSVNIRSAKAILPRALEIRKWVREYDFDIVFTNEKYSMIAAWLARISTRRKFIHLSTAHNSYAWLNNSNVCKFSRLINLTCDGFIAMASFVKEALIEAGFPKHKMLLLPNTLEAGIIDAKDNYALENPVCRLVYTAAIYPGKRQDFVIDIIRLLKNEGVEASIDFYGEVVDKQYFESIVNSVNNYGLKDYVNFKGRVENDVLRHQLCKYDVYICPTKMEMSPFSILEAQEAALPIVSTNVGGIPDMIRDKWNGILVNQSDTPGFAKALSEMIKNQDLREFLGKNALAFVTVDNAPELASSKIRQFIESIKG